MSIAVSEIRAYPADRLIPSPNQGTRTHRFISLIVLHGTGTHPGENPENAMADPAHKAAAHLHFRRDGSVTRMVGDRRRAWHAGDSSWPGVGDVNSESLGWEIENDNRGEPYTGRAVRAGGRRAPALPAAGARAQRGRIARGRSARPEDGPGRLGLGAHVAPLRRRDRGPRDRPSPRPPDPATPSPW